MTIYASDEYDDLRERLKLYADVLEQMPVGLYSTITTPPNATTNGSALLTVKVAPTIASTGQPVSTSVVAPNTARFTVTASGTATLTYQWQTDSASCATSCAWANVSTGTGGTTASYTTPATTSSMNGFKYRVIVTNSCGSVTSNGIATLTVTSSILYGLAVADASTRTVNARNLQSAMLTGTEYVFTSPAGSSASNPSGISKVDFYQASSACPGTLASSDSATPYDYAGTASGGGANPWNTINYANGTWCIKQVVTKSAGGTETDTATFTVRNTTHTVGLSWTKDTDPNAVTYSMWRSTTSCPQVSPTRVLQNWSPTSWTDSTVSSGSPKYCYAVTETDTSTGLESVKSTAVEADIP